MSMYCLIVFDVHVYTMLHVHVHCALLNSVAEGKSVVLQLEWSMDGNRLLALSEDSTIKVHRMKVSSVMCLGYCLIPLSLSLSLSLSPPDPLHQ